MSRRTRAIATAVYVAALLLPFAWIAFHSTGDLHRWLDRGVCPAGPMDRPVRPCSLFELVFIVFLGGWDSFVVVPALVLWGALVTVVAWAVSRTLRR